MLRQYVGVRRARHRLLRSAPGATLHRDVEVRSPERLKLAPGVFVDRGVLLHCGGMDWSGEEAGIVLGPNTYIGPNAVLFGAGGIHVGEGGLISPGVVITSHQHTFAADDDDMRAQPLDFGTVTIERDVWIGANATVLPGVRIGAGSVVGAGAVVTRDVAPGSVVTGVPARVKHVR
jgi:acetyltransferase-like isoleucine patch superfamily enzyme